MPNFLASALFFICAIVFLSSPAKATDGTRLDAAQLADLFKQFIITDSPFAAKDLEFSNITCRPETLELPHGTIEYLLDMGPTAGRLGLRTFAVDVLVNGKQEAHVKMAGTVQLYGTVLSAARTLRRNTILSSEDIISTRRNITMLGGDLPQDLDLVVGKQLKTTLQPGSVLFAKVLKTPQIVKRGDMVTILAESKQIHVSVPGKARSSGALGDIIKVKNMMSRKEVYAKIINHNEVQVEF